VRFASLDEFVAAEVEGTPMIEMIDDEVYERIRKESRDALAGFCSPDGGTEVPIEGHLVVARKQ
jgi:hypothetical protein